VEAALDGFSLTQLTIERVSQNKHVFYDGKDGSGSHITVYCGGKIVSQSASGGTMTMVARTWDAQNQAIDQSQCMLRCAHKNRVCLEHNQNITNSECKAACEPSCP